MLQSTLEDPNSPIYDWRFWAYCGVCFIVVLTVMYFVDKDKP